MVYTMGFVLPGPRLNRGLSFIFIFVFIFAGMKGTYKKIWKWFRIIVVIYVLGGVALYFLQDYILFHPVTLKRDHNYDFTEKHKDINIPINEKSNLNIVQFFSTDTVTRGVVLYFHGNKKKHILVREVSALFYQTWI